MIHGLRIEFECTVPLTWKYPEQRRNILDSLDGYLRKNSDKYSVTIEEGYVSGEKEDILNWLENLELESTGTRPFGLYLLDERNGSTL